MCRLNSCYGCGSLKTGTVVQGSLDLLWASVMMFLAIILWLHYAVMIALDDDSVEPFVPEEIRLLVLTYAIAFTVFPFLLLARAGILLSAAYKQSAALVMGGILITVVELVSILCLSVCSFMFFHPVAGAVPVLFVPITIFTLVPLISYYLQLRAGRTSDSVHVGVVSSTGQPPEGTRTLASRGSLGVRPISWVHRD